MSEGTPIRLAELSGSARERGRLHGREIPDALQRYWRELVLDVTERSDHPMSEEALAGWVRERAAPALSLEPDLEEEIRGIAEGAGVGYELALAVNLGEEVNHLAYSLGWRAPAVQRCLSIVVPPEQSQTGGYLLAQTWDGPNWIPDPMMFIVDEEAGRSAFIADPGWVGGAGLNDRGIGSVHTGVGTKVDGTPGLPYSFIARRILRSDDLQSATESVTVLSATAGCHYIVVDGERVVDVETAGPANAALTYTGPISTCAHFSDPSCRATESDPGKRLVSEFRVGRLLDLFQQAAPVSPLDLFRLISDHEPGPDGAAVCLHPGSMRSLGSVVIDLAGRTTWGKAGNPCLPRPVTQVTLFDSGYDSRTFTLTENQAVPAPQP
jgi:isopenicillin-N N-acyltransferase like protein